SPGDQVEEGDVLIILEAMKMETEVRAPKAGTVGEIFIKVGDAVAVDDEMLTIA
ncbi:biotin/lipoyl-containing protein, partial [Marinobacter persicus]